MTKRGGNIDWETLMHEASKPEVQEREFRELVVRKLSRIERRMVTIQWLIAAVVVLALFLLLG